MQRLVFLLLAMALMAAGAVEASAADSARTTVRRHRPVVVFTHSASIIRLAERGNARAQARLGFLYEYGRGLPQDFALAAMW